MPELTAEEIIRFHTDGDVAHAQSLLRELRAQGYHIISEAEWERTNRPQGYVELRVTGTLDGQLVESKQEIHDSLLRATRDPENFMRHARNTVARSFLEFIGEHLGYRGKHVS